MTFCTYIQTELVKKLITVSLILDEFSCSTEQQAIISEAISYTLYFFTQYQAQGYAGKYSAYHITLE